MPANQEEINQINSIEAAQKYQQEGRSFTLEEQELFTSNYLKKTDDRNRFTSELNVPELQNTVEFLFNFKEAQESVLYEPVGLSDNGKKLLNHLFQARRTNPSLAYQVVKTKYGEEVDKVIEDEINKRLAKIIDEKKIANLEKPCQPTKKK